MDQTSLLSIAGKLGGQGAPGTFFGLTMWGALSSLLFSGIGLYYFKRGRYLNDTNKTVCGVALLLYPYFVTNTVYIAVIGLALMAAPYIMERYF